jgi:hypothetical protein
MYQALAGAGAQCLFHGEVCDLTPQKITGELVAECSGGCADQPGLADRDNRAPEDGSSAIGVFQGSVSRL